MTKNDKNIIIITTLGIIAVLIWTFTQYTTSQKRYATNKLHAQEQENMQENSIQEQNTPQETVIPTISALELNRMLTNNDFTIIDLRSRENFDNGHITGSFHVDTIDLTQTQRTIILVTNTGGEESILSYYRNISADKTVYNLAAGIEGWTKEGFVLLTLNTTPSFATSAKVQLIEPRDFDALTKDVEALQDVLIIDTRRPGNYENGHVPYAINIPLTEIESRSAEISLTKKIYVYGADEQSSFQSGALLYDLRHIGTKTMKGGFAAWEEYNYPIIQ